MRGVHLQVVDHALVDHLRLRRGHPLDPISAGELAACGDSAVAPDGDPQHVQSAKSLLPPLLRYHSAEEDLIDDDPGARTGHRGDPVHPRRFHGRLIARQLDDMHLVIRADSAFTQKTYVHASGEDLQRGQAALARIYKIV